MLVRLIKELLNKVLPSSAAVSLDQVHDAMKSGNLDKARALCDIVLSSRPDHIDALHLAGVIARQQGDEARAIALLTRAAESPTDPQPALGLGQMLQDAGRRDEAIMYFRRAVEIDPELYTSRIALGNALHKRGDIAESEAEVNLRCAIALQPDSLDAHALLASVLYQQARTLEVAETVHNMQRIKHADGKSILLALLLPALYQSTQEIIQVREDLVRKIDELLEGPPLSVSDPVTEIGITPFYLAYHGLNDREIQKRIVQLCRKAYRPACNSPLALRPRSRRIRIGFVSMHFRLHSIGRINHGFISALRRDKFEVTVFSLTRHDDALARKIRADSDHYVQFDGEPLARIEQVIAGHEMDVLFYCDVGMDALSYFLAYSRLAPLQCVSWGHPDTTGIDTLDVFVSAHALELPEAGAHYSEELVRLPAWIMPGYQCPPQPTSLKPRSAFGLGDDSHIYACPQSLFKIHPDFDRAIAEILREDPRGEVVFLEGRHAHLGAMLKQRLDRTIPDVKGRIRFLPGLSWQDYLNLISISDVMLDPFHFGGGNTTYESLAMGIPVVTLPSRFLRGRFSLGCYLKMGMTECVAGTTAQYAETTLRLGTDADYRHFVVNKIAETRSVLFDNYEMVKALETFLEHACSSTRA